MNKQELVIALAKKADLTRKNADAALNAITTIIADELTAGESVSLIGFGTFGVKAREAREGRNPRTGETVKIAASKAPYFKAGKVLKDKVNG
jgi:DNA-binding protein HU-beta